MYLCVSAETTSVARRRRREAAGAARVYRARDGAPIERHGKEHGFSKQYSQIGGSLAHIGDAFSRERRAERGPSWSCRNKAAWPHSPSLARRRP